MMLRSQPGATLFPYTTLFRSSGVLGLTWTTMVNVAVAPLARDAVVQLTVPVEPTAGVVQVQDRKSTRLNSSHQISSYAVFCSQNNATGPPLVTLTAPVREQPG